MLLERNSILRKWFSGQNTGALSATADYAQGTGCTPGATSRVWPRRVRGWLISTPGAIVLNHISFPSQWYKASSQGSLQLLVASTRAHSQECLLNSWYCCGFCSGNGHYCSSCHFTAQVSLNLQLNWGLLQTHWKRASPQDGFKDISAPTFSFLSCLAHLAQSLSLQQLTFQWHLCTKVSSKLCRQCPAAPGQQLSVVPLQHEAASSLHCRKAGDG